MTWKIATTIGALALIPSLACAQQQSSSDTTMRGDTTMRDTSRITTTEEGQVDLSTPNLGMTTEQVKELQKAINDNGCDAGPVTGTVDDQTQQGIECIRHAKNIDSKDINDVVKALDLDFTVEGNAPPQTQSGVTDTKTGESTLGEDVKHARPTGIKGVVGDSAQSDTSDTTTQKSDSTTWRTDSGAIQSDTSTMQQYDTTTVQQDTTTLQHDTTMMQHDTTMMQRDSMPVPPDTSRSTPRKL
ncbi:MAG TPA: hypothetical protein VIQ74_15180 [Gemmatimonadaceae bacterium]|jgi:hypothetical protein